MNLPGFRSQSGAGACRRHAFGRKEGGPLQRARRCGARGGL